MNGTFSQMYIQMVFAVEHRDALIRPEWEEQLYKYITGILTKKGQKMLAINGMPDHLHIVMGMKPSCCLSDLVREVKKSSNTFIEEKGFTPFKFNWQEGFGAFSYSHSHLDKVIKYVMNQKEHHRKQTFRDEYIAMLKAFNVEYDERYLFRFLD